MFNDQRACEPPRQWPRWTLLALPPFSWVCSLRYSNTWRDMLSSRGMRPSAGLFWTPSDSEHSWRSSSMYRASSSVKSIVWMLRRALRGEFFKAESSYDRCILSSPSFLALCLGLVLSNDEAFHFTPPADFGDDIDERRSKTRTQNAGTNRHKLRSCYDIFFTFTHSSQTAKGS